MKKRILSLFLVAIMVLTLLPATAFATEPEHNHTAWTPISDMNGLKSLFSTGGSGYLTAQIDCTEVLTVTTGKTVDLCLNGKVLNLNSKYISIPAANTVLSIYDCDTTTVHKFSVNNTTGLWTLNEASGTKTVTGGVITGGNGHLDETNYWRGGAVHVNCGTLNLYGGTLVGNQTSSDKSNQGGAVYVGGGDYSKGKFNMYGGAIVGNYSKSVGGGVFVNKGKMTMTGGSITDNVIGTNYSGAVYVVVVSGEITLGGTAKILNNFDSDGKQKNLMVYGESQYYPDEGWKIRFDDNCPPVDGFKVGACRYKSAGATGIFTTKSAKSGYEKFFVSDDGYKVSFDSSNNTLLFGERPAGSAWYIDENGEDVTLAAGDFTQMTSAMTTWDVTKPLYVSGGKVTISNAVTLSADTVLILADGAELEIAGGITGGKTLTVYGQSLGSGKLTVSNSMTGSLIVCGGTATVSGATGVDGGVAVKGDGLALINGSNAAISNETIVKAAVQVSNDGVSYTDWDKTTALTAFKYLKLTKILHEHSFTYEETGNTITATCSVADGCDLDDNKVTLTLTAEDTVYTGSAYEATTDDEAVGFTSATGAIVAIEYWSTGASPEKLNPAPITPGSYTAKAVVTYPAADGTATVTAVKDFKITKKDLAKEDLSITMSDAEYDKQAHGATVALKDGLSGIGEITVKYQKKNADSTWGEATTEAPVDAGTYKIVVSALSGDNFNATAADLDTEAAFTISPKTVELVWQPATGEGAIDLVYSGKEKVPTVTVKPEILLDGDECTVTADLTADNNNVNVGSFTFTAKSLSNSNYKLPNTKVSDSYAITPFKTSLGNLVNTANFDNNRHGITFTPATPEGANDLQQSDFTVQYYKVDMDTDAITLLTKEPANLGRYIYVVTLNSGHDNYTLGSENLFSGTPASEADVANKVNAGIFTIGVPSLPTQQKPISFEKGLVNALVTDTGVTNALTNENTSTLSATTTYSSSNTSVATVNATTGEVTIVAAGSTTITATSHVADPDVTDVYASYTLNVTKNAITVTVKDKEIIYGGANPYEGYSNIGDVLGFSETIDTTSITPAFTTSYAPGKSVGQYNVSVTLPESAEYSFTYVPGTLTVDQKSLTVSDFTVSAEDKAYDGSNIASVKVTAIGNLYSGDAITATAIGTFADANVGTGKTVNYEITGISGAKAGNYKLTGQMTGNDITADIDAMPVTFTVGSTEFYYDGTAKTVAITAKDAKNNSFTAFTVTYGGAASQTVVGNYAIAVTLTDANYTIANTADVTGKQLEISKMPIAFAFGASEFGYDGGKKTVQVSATDKDNRVFTDYTVKYTGTGSTTYDESATAPTDVGTYTVTAVYDTGKYECTSNTTTLTITAGDAVVWASAGLSHKFDGQPKAVTAMSAQNGLALNVTYYAVDNSANTVGELVEAPANIGRYLYVITLDNNKNYVISNPLDTTNIVGKAISELSGSNFGIMTIDINAQEPISFAQAFVNKLTTDGTYTQTVTNPNAGSTVTYTSSNTDVATVNASTGAVTFKGVAGTTTITAASTLAGYGTVYASYTLSIGEQSVVVKVRNLNIIYGDADPYDAVDDLEFSPVISTEDLGTPAFTTSYEVGEGVGQYPVTVSGLTSDKYIFTYVAGTLVVNPKTLNAEDFTVTAEDKAYDGSTAATLKAATKSGLVGSDKLTVSASGSFTDAAVGTGKTVNYQITGISGNKAGNYVLGTTAGSTTADITNEEVSFTFGTLEFAFDGSRKLPAVSAVDSENRVFTAYTVYYEGTGGTTYDKSTDAPVNVGTYKVIAEFDTEKYVLADGNSNAADMEITCGSVAVWASSGTEHLYSDPDKTITVRSIPELELGVTYYAVDEDGAIGDTVTPDELGEYLYVITLADNDTNKNYAITNGLTGKPSGKVDELSGSNFGIMTILDSAQPPLVVDEIVVNKTYGDEPFTQVITGGVEGAEITYSIPNTEELEFAEVHTTTGAITIKKPGTVVVEVKASKTGYTDVTARFAVVIEKRQVVIDLDDSVRYTGEVINAPYEISNDLAGNRVQTEDIVFTYQNLGDSQDPGSFRNVGTYYVTAEISSANEYYRSNGAASKNVDITKASLKITADDKNVIYGDAAPAYTFSCEPLGTDTVASLEGSAVYTCEYDQYDDKGDYTISLDGLSSDNYDITFVDGTLTVDPLAVTLSWPEISFIYDGQEHSAIAVVSNAVNGDPVEVSAYTGNTGTAKGDYTAEATALDDSNYTLKGGFGLSQAWTISVKPVTVKPADLKVYVGGTAELKLDVSALLAADQTFTGTPVFTLADKDGKTVDAAEAVKTAGDYTITWTNPDAIKFNENYDVTKELSAVLTVLQPSSGGGGGVQPAITVPVSGEDNAIEVKASVSENTAAIAAPTDEELETILDKSVETGVVSIDLTGLDSDIDSVVVPTSMVKTIADAAEDENNDVDGLAVKLDTATVEFDVTALKAVVDQAKGEDIQIVIEEVGTTRLNDKQLETLAELDVKEGYEAYVISGGTRISDFGGGNVSVIIPFVPAEGTVGKEYDVYYVSDDGSLEKLNAEYDSKNLCFVVSHFSDYVVVYEGLGYFNCPKDETCPMSKFTDVDMKAWYHDGVHYCLDNGIMAGFPGDLFKPNGTTTRAQIVTILWNMNATPYVNYAMNFSDVEEGQWYAEAVRWAAAENIVAGYTDGTFKPDAPITREQLAVILYNYAQYKGIDVSVDENTNFLSFNDFWDTSEWAKPAMMWAIDRELIVGTNWDLKPQGDAVRAQAATIIWKFCETVAK